MKNNLEEKAKFFAQYWGVKCLRNELLNETITPQKIGLHNCKGLPQQFLELTPLSQISDEHAIEVARIVSPDMFMSAGDDGKHFIDRKYYPTWITVRHKRKIMSVDIDMDGYTVICNEDDEYLRNPFAHLAINYLRSKGYALPYLNYSVEDLIKMNWIKLKDNE